MKYQLKPNEQSYIELVEKITDTNYEVDNENYIEIDNLVSALIDLASEYIRQEEEFTNYKEFVKENYKQKTLEESYR